MAQAIGQECIMTVGGLAVPALLRSASPSFTYATQPKLSSGPQVGGVDQTLLGYSPSTGARSGFQIDFQVPYAGAAAFITQCLDVTGSTIVLGFGAAGGVSVATCLAELLEVTGTEGGDVEGRGTFQSIATPATGVSGSVPDAHDFFRFLDVTSITLPARSHVDVNAFAWRIQRVLAAYRGNSPNGIPKYLRIARTECMLDATYLKHDDQEGAAQAHTPLPLTVADSSVLLTRVPLYGTGSQTLTLTCKDSFADTFPQIQGGFETFLTESLSVRSTTGTYTVA